MRFMKATIFLTALHSASCLLGSSHPRRYALHLLSSQPWDGEVVSNPGGVIQGCSIEPVGDSGTEWTINIDG